MFRLRAWPIAALVLIVAAGCGPFSSSSAAGSVNGHDISMTDYNHQFRSTRIEFSDGHGYDACGMKGLEAICRQIKKQALTTLIDKELIREYANEHHITVSQRDFDVRWASVFRVRFDSQDAVLNIFAKRLGVSPDDIKQGVRDDLLQERVEYDVTKSMPLHAPALELARVVTVGKKELKETVALLRSGDRFLQIVKYLQKTSTNGCSKVQCGLMGWIPYYFIPPAKRSLIHARVGTVQGPFAEATDSLFFYILGRDPHYLMNANQQYARRTQLFTAWLHQQERHARVKRYVAT